MPFARNSIAATIAALLIGGVAISPASAAVRNEISQFDINQQLHDLELRDDPDRKIDPPFNTDHVTPDGKTRMVSKDHLSKKG
jgi:hypothetical protein